MTPDEAWIVFHEQIEAVCWEAHEGDPTTDRDNKFVIPSWAMKVVFLETWRLAQSVGEGD